LVFIGYLLIKKLSMLRYAKNVPIPYKQAFLVIFSGNNKLLTGAVAGWVTR